MVNPSKKLIINTLVYSWRPQINAVTLKVSKGLGLLSKIRHYVPGETVHAHTDYNFLNWGMAVPSNLLTIHTKINQNTP